MPEDTLPTRETLILRLRDSEDESSWSEFVKIYTPLLYGYCRKRELSAADTADIVQEVMRSVSLAIKNFTYDPEKGRFKSWLFTATRNAVSRHFKEQARRPMTAGNTRLVEMIERTPDQREIDDWERDYQRKLLAWAMEKVKPEFAPRIWSAFEQTAIFERSAQDVAAELGISKNAVTIAKWRVVQRLREKARTVDSEHWEGEMIDGLKKP